MSRLLAWPLLNHLALAVATLAVLLAGSVALTQMHPLDEGGWFGWPVLLGAYFALLWLYEKSGDDALGAGLPWLHALGFWVVTGVATVEIHWRVAQEVYGVWPHLLWGMVPAALLWLAAHVQGIWPLSSQRDAYQNLGAVPLVLVIVGWIVGINLFNTGDPVYVPYIPLLNPLDVAVMLGLLVVADWWFALPAPRRGVILSTGDPRFLPGVAAAIVFLWLNAALIRALHYGWGAPLDFELAMKSFFVQSALSIFWGLLGFTAMITGTRKGWRIAWLAGAGLMAVVVVKLFLVDLSGSATLARIVSFISIGVLLLITGYFSPLPPKQQAKEAAE